ncbi:hypothetical protein MKX08_001954 [Trichoderma sp. CBMAI-0020]|nr:hypothetical protein MKX08_001954 [Trichoderma sp. CBMAI-0020]WOD45905.1 hypothetical protein [Trichoderma atroviride]
MKSTLESTNFDADRYMRGKDRRRKRVSKACERCRIKKIKCDGELPCQKCKNHGTVCTAGIRKRTIHVEYKQVPRSYVEFLETTHLALIGTVHKLYKMIQKNQPWDLGEPELNDQGELVIHDIAKKLGCIGPNDEIELPIQYELPTTASGMARVAAHPKRLQYGDYDAEDSDDKEPDSPANDSTDESVPSLEPMQGVETELNYQRDAFASHSHRATKSPQSAYSCDDLDNSHSESEGANTCVTSPYISTSSDCTDFSQPSLGIVPDDMALFLQQYGPIPATEKMTWELGDSSYGTHKYNLSETSDIESLLMENQMVFPDYNGLFGIGITDTNVDVATYEAQLVSEIDRLRSRIDDAAICQLASRLNGCRSCKIEYSSMVGPGALMGCANYHARIRFQDGSPSWLLRVPRVASFAVGLPAPLADYLIASEYATLKFLETIAVPAPRAFDYGVCSNGTDHGVGLAFLLMEELPGRPWSAITATDDEKAQIWSELAEILAELEHHPFPKAGSLCFQSSSIQVSAVASDRFIVLTPHGPFDNSTAYYTAFAEQYLALIADGQLYTEFPIDSYLVYRFLKDNVSQLVEHGGEAKPSEDYFLKHVDDKGDHLLVDDNLRITGIIDWQMARVVPRREAFGPSLVTADMNALCGGKVSLSADDVALMDALRQKGLSWMTSCAVDEKARRFFWGLALKSEWSDALPLAIAILQVFGVDQAWAQWRETALKEYESDERLKDLLSVVASE